MLNLLRLALIGLLFVVLAVSQAQAFGGRVVSRQRIVTRAQPVRQKVIVQQQAVYAQPVVQQQVVQRVYAQPVVVQQQRVYAQPIIQQQVQPYCAPNAGNLQLQQNSCNAFFAP